MTPRKFQQIIKEKAKMLDPEADISVTIKIEINDKDIRYEVWCFAHFGFEPDAKESYFPFHYKSKTVHDIIAELDRKVLGVKKNNHLNF